MGWREFITEKIGPGALCGLPLGDWLRLVADNRCAIDPPYWLRAGTITWGAMQNTIFRWWERARYERAIQATQPLAPLFILGIWRSGTTHLHNLLARDERFAYPNTYEALYPHTFLKTQPTGRRVMQWMMPATRPMDNVEAGVGAPPEDAFALVASGLTFI